MFLERFGEWLAQTTWKYYNISFILQYFYNDHKIFLKIIDIPETSMQYSENDALI